MSSRRWAALTAATMMLTTVGACAVEEPDNDRASEQVLADKHVEIDLDNPPTRADLGVPDGRKTYFLELPDKTPYEVTVNFTNGTSLTTPAHVVGVTTDGSSDPTGLSIVRHDLTLPELEQALRDSVEDFGVDDARVDSYLRSAATATERESTVNVALPAPGVGPEFLEVQPITHGFDQRYQLNYLIEWGRD